MPFIWPFGFLFCYIGIKNYKSFFSEQKMEKNTLNCKNQFKVVFLPINSYFELNWPALFAAACYFPTACVEALSVNKALKCPLLTPCVSLSFLKLYTTMPVAKLAGFLDMSEQEFRIQLLVFKHKMKNLVWTSGISALDGEFQSASEVDFYIDKVCVCVCVCWVCL